MNFFEKISYLGQKLENKVKKSNNFDDFHILARNIFENENLEGYSLQEIFGDLLKYRSLPPQMFLKKTLTGDQCITLFESEDRSFVINFHLWGQKSITDCHRHGFNGIYYVLAGKTIDLDFRFTEINCEQGISEGKLELQNFNVLFPGDIGSLFHTEDQAHRAIHLGHQSISLVIRTLNNEINNPGYFFSPSFRCQLRSIERYGFQVVWKKFALFDYALRNGIWDKVKSMQIFLSGMTLGELIITAKLSENEFVRSKLLPVRVLKGLQWEEDFRSIYNSLESEKSIMCFTSLVFSGSYKEALEKLHMGFTIMPEEAEKEFLILHENFKLDDVLFSETMKDLKRHSVPESIQGN